MTNKKYFYFLTIFVILALALAACGGNNEPANETANEADAPMEEAIDCKASGAAESEGAYQIPAAIDGCYNVGFVYVGPHDDGGWSQAHDVGRMWVEDNVEGVHTAYVEIVAEGADAEQVIRSLARKGFDVIFTTSFGYMDASEVVAEEFPDVDIIHVSGFKSNEANFGNLMGAMEDMKYLAGMLAGSRTKADGGDQVGGMATFPIPEEYRLFNAYAMGVQQTCPECKVDLLWINTWHDPIIEREGADSLFDAGANVVMTGADTPASALAAADREGVYGITYDWIGSCTIDECLTAPYWVWGPVFARITEAAMVGEYEYGWDYFEASEGGIGLYGFMEGQEVQPGVASLPEADVQMVKDLLAEMLAGEFTRFDIFTGPIMDNTGNMVIEEGMSFEYADIDQFAPGAPGLEAKYGMFWWNENINADLPDL